MAEHPTHRLITGADFRVEPIDQPGGGTLVRFTDVEIVPPDYDAQDLADLIARKVEDAAFALDKREFDHRPSRDALVAGAARVLALEDLFKKFPRTGQFAAWAAKIQHIIEATNAQITAEWGQDPEE